MEYPDHVVEAFLVQFDLHENVFVQPVDGTMQRLKHLMTGFLETFYMGWKARAEKDPADVKVPTLGMADKLHEELSSWLERMKRSGEHPTLTELGTMTTRALLVKRVITKIRNQIDYELV